MISSCGLSCVLLVRTATRIDKKTTPINSETDTTACPHEVFGCGESAVDFAGRVQKLIAERAGLKVVPWDGMYKYITPRPETRERQRRAFAERMRGKVGLEEPSGVGAASEGKEA